MTSRLRFAVVGNPIAHSRSPEIHQLFARQFGIELTYEKLLAPVDDFAAVAKAFFDDGGSGLNVTVPFKQDAARWVDVLDPTAAAVGAVNTIYAGSAARAEDDQQIWHGANTDGAGLLADLVRLGWPVQGQRIALLGAGGAARGALHALLQAAPASVVVANRTRATAEQLARELAPSAPAVPLLTEAPVALREPFDLLINATSLGLSAGAEAFSALLPRLGLDGTRCYDMVYGDNTAFLRFAADRSAAAIADGFGMLIGQAAVAFEHWHGVRPSLEDTLKALQA
ncbi:MAG: shikimate dehydrogenase [Pseudomonadota bacterium]